MRLVEQVADLRVREQDLVHAVGDRGAAFLQCGNGRLDNIDGPVAERGSHGDASFCSLFCSFRLGEFQRRQPGLSAGQ
jgi:hypothetical protein